MKEITKNSIELFESETIIYDCPAFSTHKLQPKQTGCIELYDGDEIYCNVRGTVGQKFSVGSVISYAFRNGNDPIALYKRAVEHGHPIHYIFGLGVCLTSGKQLKDRFIHIELGQRVKFEGIYFTIEKAPNDNLKFVRCDD